MILQIIKGRFYSIQFSSYEIGIILGSSMLIILSGFDGAMTLWGLSEKVIEEANPIMDAMISKSPRGVMIVKLLLPVVLGVLCWLVRDRSQRLIKCSLGFVLAIYLFIDLVHLYWWYLLI